MNIKELLSLQLRTNGSKPAIIFQKEAISFEEVRDKAFKIANYLVQKGFSSGDKAAIFMPNVVESVYAQLGVFSVGGTLVPFDFMLTEDEIVRLINHSESDFLFISSRKGIDIENIKKNCLRLKSVVIAGDGVGGDSLTSILEMGDANDFDYVHNEKALAAIFYTSGSTGKPKGVMLSYNHFDNPVETIGEKLNVTQDEIFLCGGVPFSHLGGLDYILLMVYFGTTMVLMERFHPLEFIRQCQDYGVTVFCIVPAMYVAILMLKVYDKFDLSKLRYAVVFGAPSSPRLLRKFSQAYPNAKLLNGWGMTETSAPNTYSPDNVDKIASIGQFGYGMSAKIVNEQGEDVGGCGSGELWVKGKGVMLGYYKDETLTNATITADGWLKTGDVVRRDEDGDFYVVGRKKDMIKVAGEIVFAYEIEEVLLRYEKVKEAAVVGVADDLRGETVRAFLALKEGCECGVTEIREYAKQKMAHFKVPHDFVFLNELPKNRVGKIDKTMLVNNELSLDNEEKKGF